MCIIWNVPASKCWALYITFFSKWIIFHRILNMILIYRICEQILSIQLKFLLTLRQFMLTKAPLLRQLIRFQSNRSNISLSQEKSANCMRGLVLRKTTEASFWLNEAIKNLGAHRVSNPHSWLLLMSKSPKLTSQRRADQLLW
jgi:hypothetical protein